jgi:hypothetical protein
MSTYSYPLSAFPQTRAACGTLKKEVEAAIPGGVHTGCTCFEDTVQIGFTRDLTAPEVTALDTVVAAHAGVEMTMVFHATSKVLDSAVQVTSTDTWQEMGGVITNPGFFVSDLTRAFGQLTGQAKVVGTGAEVRLVEDVGGVLYPLITGTLTDTAGAWAVASWTSVGIPQAGGERPILLQARLNGATSAWLRYMSATLMELILS